MPYMLDSLARDLGQALDEKSGAEAHAALCTAVETALKDEAFLAANCGPDKTKPREIIYEDADKGFCICVHSYEGGASSAPHDHGHTWALYGQAAGTTEMTDWRIVKAAEGDQPARVEPVRTYTLTPGKAHFYEAGAVHSPKRAGATKLLRIEGANLDHVKRTPIEPVETAAA